MQWIVWVTLTALSVFSQDVLCFPLLVILLVDKFPLCVTLQVDKYPEVTVSRDETRATSHRENIKSAFIPAERTVWQRAILAWYSFYVQFRSNPNGFWTLRKPCVTQPGCSQEGPQLCHRGVLGQCVSGIQIKLKSLSLTTVVCSDPVSYTHLTLPTKLSV